MAAEAVGTITCKWCGTRSEVRKNSKRKYYVYCGHCGINQPALPGFQTIIINQAEFYPAELEIVQRLAAYKPETLKREPEPEKPKPEPKQEPVAERKQEPEPEKPKPEPVAEPKRRGLSNLAAGVAAFMGAEE